MHKGSPKRDMDTTASCGKSPEPRTWAAIERCRGTTNEECSTGSKCSQQQIGGALFSNSNAKVPSQL